MPYQIPHADTTTVVWNVQSVANGQNRQNRGPSGNAQLPTAKRPVSVPAGKRDSSRGGSSVPSTIQHQNPTPSSSLNNSRIEEITQRVTSTPSTTQRWSIITPTATPDPSSRNTPAPSGTIQTYPTPHVVSRPASGIAHTPTPLSGLENLPTPIPNPEACAIITNPPRTWATETNQRGRQWQLQPLAVSTPRSIVSGSRSIPRFGHSDRTRFVFIMGRLLEVDIRNRWPCMSASDFEMVS